MKKIISILLMIFLSIAMTACGGTDNKSSVSFIISEDGTCDGFGKITWGMSEAEVIEITGGIKNDSMQGINVENCIFEGIPGMVHYGIEDGLVQSGMFITEEGNPGKNYDRIYEKLTELFGEPSDYNSITESYEQGGYSVFAWWAKDIYTSDGRELDINIYYSPLSKKVQMNFWTSFAE